MKTFLVNSYVIVNFFYDIVFRNNFGQYNIYKNQFLAKRKNKIPLIKNIIFIQINLLKN